MMQVHRRRPEPCPTGRDRLTAAIADPDTTVGARALLGAVLVGHDVTLRITEVEAYAGPRDPASHAFVRTARSEIMYGPPDRLYVYRIHGHFCANVVTGPDGLASAVLLRAGEVLDGSARAHRRRAAVRAAPVAESALARGPGNLTRAVGITMDDLGADLGDGTSLTLLPADHQVDRAAISAGPRVGVRRNADLAWRFWLTDDPTVSAYRRHPRAAVGN
ncbi:DNA-3-methyladenine glycosylase [Gordonia sp. L191]|uniref:DNA-3-methyladenine glycosylase n=1 Tax=Gordonia sp. L191 TaxID=2982699 RepID=UPI0024C01184|nr:DNA-3-methyladenine glycosylase [Gordonia sp. L191]WHU48052.1 DNA-3-methyladenine glycosylase [Gordonia sp. L191]